MDISQGQGGGGRRCTIVSELRGDWARRGLGRIVFKVFDFRYIDGNSPSCPR